MKTVTEHLVAMGSDMKAMLKELLHTHARLGRMPEHDSVVWIGPQGVWEPLGVEGRQLQSRLLRLLDQYGPLVATLLRGQRAQDHRKLTEYLDRLRHTIEQSQLTWEANTAQAETKAVAAIDGIEHLLAGCYDPSAGQPIFAPDTNALIYNPALEAWRFEGATPFRLALTPAVTSELDRLKINHRVEEVRKKAERVIRTIKGYRARGSLLEGVPLVRGVSEVFQIATEPDMTATLPWLDPSNDDDRFLASTIEVMRLHPRSAVIIVTRDINLQNKAELARIPFVEPPEGEVGEAVAP